MSMYIYIYMMCFQNILYTCLCWVSLFRCWNRWSFIQILGQVLLFLLPLTPFRLGVRCRWSVDTYTKGTCIALFFITLCFFSPTGSRRTSSCIRTWLLTNPFLVFFFLLSWGGGVGEGDGERFLFLALPGFLSLRSSGVVTSSVRVLAEILFLLGQPSPTS